MKKTIAVILLKTIAVILLAILCLWLIMFTIDYICVSNLNRPVFVVPGIVYFDGGSGLYYGLGYTVEIEMHDFDALASAEMRLFGKILIAASIT